MDAPELPPLHSDHAVWLACAAIVLLATLLLAGIWQMFGPLLARPDVWATALAPPPDPTPP